MQTRLISTLALSLILSACSLKLDPNIQLPTIPGPSAPKLTCSAVLSSSAGGSVISGQAAPIEVTAAGGVAPYTIFNEPISFQSTTVVARTFTNDTNANVVKVGTIQILDSANTLAQCNYSVTVAPAGTTPSTLACVLDASPASGAAINQNVVFTATASGGLAPYTFSNFAVGTGGSVVSALASVSATQSMATGKYSSSGLRAATVKLTDNSGSFVTCAKSVDIAVAPSVSAVVSPASSVVAGNSITLTASSAAFSSTPSYSFSTSRAGVTISSTGNVATVTSTAVQSAFDVVVTATAGSQSASYTVVGLAFTSPGSLGCTLVLPTGTLLTNSNVAFSVVPMAPATDALQITYFATHSDGTVTASSNAGRSVKYTVPGVKTILVQAKSLSTGALCQAGSVMSGQVEISAGSTTPPTGALTCNAFTSYNPSYTGEYFYAWANISGGSGSKWVDTITPNMGTLDGYWVDATKAYVRFFTSGSYTLTFAVKDSAGNTGSCSTTQVVWPQYYW